MRNEVIKVELKYVDIEYRIEAAISGGLLLQSEDDGVLLFNAMKQQDNGYWTNVGTGILEFNRLMKTKFGLPNDEARSGHQLPLSGYGMAEIKESSWVKEEEQCNQKVFPNSNFATIRHFIVMFHDSTFECLAEDYRFVVGSKLRDKIIEEYLDEIYP